MSAPTALTPTLYLIPAPLAAPGQPWLLPADRDLVCALRYFIAENLKTARGHLKALGITAPLREISFLELNQHNVFKEEVCSDFLRCGRQVGIISDAGCPAVADPGAAAVRLAAKLGFNVHPLIGPSSIILALMASGANGQSFTFKGYLPVNDQDKIPVLTAMLHRLHSGGESQIFIETPYRNERLLRFLLDFLPPDIYLTVAVNLTHPTAETVISARVIDWGARLPGLTLAKQPAVFILG